MASEALIIEANIAIIVLCSYANRLAGGGLFAYSQTNTQKFQIIIAKFERFLDRLPGRLLLPATAIIATLAFLSLSWLDAAIVSVAFFFWRMWEWGRWFDLGHEADLTRPAKPLERAIEAISFGSDTVAMLWRMAFAAPLLAYLHPVIGGIFPFIAVFLYAVGWTVWPKANPIPKNELMVGAFWGVILVILKHS